MDAEKTGKLKRFLVPSAIVLVLCLLWLLLRPYFARDGQRYDGSKSALRYEIIADWEAKPADHLYVYAAEAPEDMQKQMLEHERFPEAACRDQDNVIGYTALIIGAQTIQCHIIDWVISI